MYKDRLLTRYYELKAFGSYLATEAFATERKEISRIYKILIVRYLHTSF